MGVPQALGEFELVVLLTMLQQREAVYPRVLRDTIQEKAGRNASRAMVFITLQRLEQKGLVSSRSDAGAGRSPQTLLQS